MRLPLCRIFLVIVGVLFALSPGLSLGFATPVVFGVATVVMRSRLLGLATGVYVAALVTTFATIGAEDGSTGKAMFSVALVVNLVVGEIHAAVISPWFTRALGRRAARPPAPLVEEAAGRVAAQTRAEMANDPALHRALRRSTRRMLAREIVNDAPALAAELGIGRPDRGRGFKDGGLIDVNGVPGDVLAGLPGFDAVMAARVVAARERHGDLESGAELVVHADVPQEVVDRLHDRLLFTPRSSLAAGQPSGAGPEQPQPPQ